MKKGTLLTAIDPCLGEADNKPTLTIGKEYKIIASSSGYGSFLIINDNGNNHWFNSDSYETYFQSITPESLEELGFESHQSIDGFWKGNNSFVISMRRSVIRLNGVMILNCRTLTDLKHLIRILGV